MGLAPLRSPHATARSPHATAWSPHATAASQLCLACEATDDVATDDVIVDDVAAEESSGSRRLAPGVPLGVALREGTCWAPHNLIDL